MSVDNLQLLYLVWSNENSATEKKEKKGYFLIVRAQIHIGIRVKYGIHLILQL